MTISSETRKAGPFVGNDTSTSFPFAFKVFKAADLYVVRADEDGVETVLALTTDYTVTLNSNQNSNPGGTVTLVGGALATDYTLVVTSAVDELQPTDLTNLGGFYPQVVTDALDRLTILVQQLAEKMGRTAKLPITSAADADSLVADIVRLADSASNLDTVAGSIDNVNTVAGIDGDVTIVAGIAGNVTAVAGNATNITAVKNNAANINAVAAIDDDVTTVAANVADINNFADVYQGAKATAPTTRNDGSALQIGDLYFDTALDRMQVYASLGWKNASSSVNGTSARYRYIATAGQTTFTGVDSNGNTLAYDTGYVDVYLNGVRLDQADFTATDGTSIVLAVGASVSDEINIVGFGIFSVANIYTKAEADALLGAKANQSTTYTKTEVDSSLAAKANDNAVVKLTGNQTVAGQKTFSDPITMGSAQMPTPTGSAPIYACRAWVNFNGTGTVDRRASGNVSSITDGGTGSFTVNLTTAMPDANYSAVISGRLPTATNPEGEFYGAVGRDGVYSTTALKVRTTGNSTVTAVDPEICNVVVFR